MMSGLDKYYQIARCYRDEDLRADRQPEFTQIDIEASFVSQADIMALTEGMLRHLFSTVLNVALPEFPVLSWADAMKDYGSDRPDLRPCGWLTWPTCLLAWSSKFSTDPPMIPRVEWLPCARRAARPCLVK